MDKSKKRRASKPRAADGAARGARAEQAVASVESPAASAEPPAVSAEPPAANTGAPPANGESLGAKGEQPVSAPSAACFPIVGVGASAGGMETFIELLQQVPEGAGMAFVLVQHLDPTHASYLSDALSRAIQLPVTEIRDGMRVEPDHVYVDQFLATLSHELRTPLSSLLLQAQLLRRGTMSGERLEKACDAIERATRAQAELIDDLLDISRIVTGKLKMELHAVKIAAVVKSALEIISPSAEKKQIRISLELDSGSPIVAGDSARLEQVMLNLLTNAIKFTPEKGQVRVSVDSCEGQARVRVSDSGIGIEPQFLPHIFNRFSQESRGQSRSYGGLGLGLAIVRYMVEAHGGTIEATSAGKTMGAQFTVCLPLMSGQRGSLSSGTKARAPSTAPVAGLEGVRVLVVEDDAATREALSEMLGVCGAKVCAAQSAAEAMERFESFKPDVLVSDIAMPDEDGYALVRRIRALGAARGGDVPALALTALASEEDRQSAFQAGFQQHLAKPVDIDRLLAALSRLVKHRPARSALQERIQDA